MEYAYRKTFKVTKTFFNAPQNIQYVHKYNTLTTLSFKVDVLLVFHVIKINTSNIFDRAFYSLFYSHFRKNLVWKKRKLVSEFRNYVCTLGDSGLF